VLIALDVPSTVPAASSACTATNAAPSVRMRVSKLVLGAELAGASESADAPASTCQRATCVAPFQLA
jgi:hypothetical protein